MHFRFIPGREHSPSPQQESVVITKELWDKFEGRSREVRVLIEKSVACLRGVSCLCQDLIEMIVTLEANVEQQANKRTDLEEYIDSLLTKVIESAPEILQKNKGIERRTALRQLFR